MKKRLARLAAIAVALSLGAVLSAVPYSQGVLDGRSFVGDSGEKGKAASEKDTIHFANGRFHSEGCDAFGFGEAPYKATAAADGSVSWTAETTSAKEGKIQWKGTVRGDQIDGTYVWTKAGQKPIEYWVKGTAKK